MCRSFRIRKAGDTNRNICRHARSRDFSLKLKMKLPRITGQGMCKIAAKTGFHQKRQKGSHSFWAHPDGRTTTIPIHPGKKLPRGMVRKIVKDMDMSVSEYLRYLKKA